VIAATGVRRSWQSSWVRRMLFFAWLPALWFALGFFLFEQALMREDYRQLLTPFVASIPPDNPLSEIARGAVIGDPAVARHQMWSWLLQSFFRYPQAVIMVLVVGVVAPPLVSQDVRSRAFLLYFSRPLSRGEYALGKSATVWFYLATIATEPALCLYLLGILLSPNIEVVQATWDLPLRILAASAVLMVPTAALALCLSSMTQESRYAGFAWFAIWILGWFTYSVVTAIETVNGNLPPPGTLSPWAHVSLYHVLGQVQSWIFGFAEFGDTRLSLAIVVGVTIVSVLMLMRRIAAPMRV
jgi:hypothetical protein